MHPSEINISIIGCIPGQILTSDGPADTIQIESTNDDLMRIYYCQWIPFIFHIPQRNLEWYAYVYNVQDVNNAIITERQYDGSTYTCEAMTVCGSDAPNVRWTNICRNSYENERDSLAIIYFHWIIIWWFNLCHLMVFSLNLSVFCLFYIASAWSILQSHKQRGATTRNYKYRLIARITNNK